MIDQQRVMQMSSQGYLKFLLLMVDELKGDAFESRVHN
jgi:hypothetical protein